MERSKTMLLNTLILTTSAFFMRGIGMAFQVYLSNRIGAAGIGLFQLIASVSILAVTFAMSGVRFAAMRLVAEELGAGNFRSVAPAVRRCLGYALIFGTAAAVLLFICADFIGNVWIGDNRTILSLRLLALSLPFLSMSSVISGYFTAVCRVLKSSAVQIIEQLIRIGAIIFMLGASAGETDIETACAIIVIGGVLGDIASFILQFVLYFFDRKRYSKGIVVSSQHLTRRMLKIALPLAVSTYARTGLTTLQNLLIPRGLRRSGVSTETALSDYGMIQGMVFPVITFPSAFFYALADLLVPELTDAQVRGDKRLIETLVGRILRLCLLFSLIFAAILYFFSGQLGIALYNNCDTGRYIRLLALLMPIMYLDSVTDGMLRGLGQQIYSMRYNIWDSLLCVTLIYILLPKFAVGGYIFILYFSEIFNFTLSIGRLAKMTRLDLRLRAMAKAILAALGSVNIAMLVLRTLGFPLQATAASLGAHISFSFLLFVFLAAILGCIDKQDIRWFRIMFK